ncbi:hypothetical protein ACFLTT_01760 [Chloroflexota bacterium]
MKIKLTLAILLALAICLLPGCDGAVQEEVEIPEKPTSTSTQEFDQDALSKLQSEFDTYKAQSQQEYSELEAIYEKLLEGRTESTLVNPSWAELKAFIEHDKTDELTYIKGKFDCDGFAITLRDNAWKNGYRCAYVQMSFGNEEGHSLNAFETTDKGTVYIDCHQEDSAAYLKIGQRYGMIELNSIQFEHVNYSMDPDEFWQELTWTSYTSPFTYNYYTDYLNRLDFYNQSVNAYNNVIGSGNSELSQAQIDQWGDNLDTLYEDVSTGVINPMNVIQGIETYWN